MNKQGFVYWIHLEEHNDIKLQGYVGITSASVSERFMRHKSRARNGADNHLANAIRAYGDTLVIDTIFNGDIQACAEMEFSLRQTARIGWNIVTGGYLISEEAVKRRIKSRLGYSHSLETRTKIGESNRGNKVRLGIRHTEESKAAMSLARKGRPSHRLGSTQSEEAKRKLREANLGKTQSEETKAKRRATWAAKAAAKYPQKGSLQI
jgi:group I intron endonuclease